MWRLSLTDLCEVARKGVLHSGFHPHHQPFDSLN
jgi:hypothetical protein